MIQNEHDFQDCQKHVADLEFAIRKALVRVKGNEAAFEAAIMLQRMGLIFYRSLIDQYIGLGATEDSINTLHRLHVRVHDLEERVRYLMGQFDSLTQAVATLTTEEAAAKVREQGMEVALGAKVTSLTTQLATVQAALTALQTQTNTPVDPALQAAIDQINADVADIKTIAATPPATNDSSGSTTDPSVTPSASTAAVSAQNLAPGELPDGHPNKGPSDTISAPTLNNGPSNAGVQTTSATTNVPAANPSTPAPNNPIPSSVNSVGSGASPQTPSNSVSPGGPAPIINQNPVQNTPTPAGPDGASTNPDGSPVNPPTGTASAGTSASASTASSGGTASVSAAPTGTLVDTAAGILTDTTGKTLYLFTGTGTPDATEWPASVTVNGQTTYTYIGDKNPGDATGANLGGVWKTVPAPTPTPA